MLTLSYDWVNPLADIVSLMKPARTQMPQAPASKSVTLHDVARQAGVSLITASRALSNPGMVSEATIARVREAVAVTGYIPNLLAGGLKSRKSLMVAALVPNIAVQQFLPTVKALTDALDAAGYQLILGQTGYDHARDKREEALLATMISRRTDGIVVTGLIHSQTARDQLRRAGIPVVETWDLSDRPVDMAVGFSHLKVGSAIAGYFLGQGGAGWPSPRGRPAGRRAARGLPVHGGPRGADRGGAGPEQPRIRGRTALGDLLAQDADIEAIYCSSDQRSRKV